MGKVKLISLLFLVIFAVSLLSGFVVAGSNYGDSSFSCNPNNYLTYFRISTDNGGSDSAEAHEKSKAADYISSKLLAPDCVLKYDVPLDGNCFGGYASIEVSEQQHTNHDANWRTSDFYGYIYIFNTTNLNQFGGLLGINLKGGNEDTAAGAHKSSISKIFSFEKDLSDFKPKCASIMETKSLKDYQTKNDAGTDWKAHNTEITIEPGIYFYSHAIGSFVGDDCGDVHCSMVSLARTIDFTGERNWVSTSSSNAENGKYLAPHDSQQILLINHPVYGDFFVANHLLSSDELINVLLNVDGQSDVAKDAKISESNSVEEVFCRYYYGENAWLETSRDNNPCCGDNPSDLGLITSDTRYNCTENGWVLLTPQESCEDYDDAYSCQYEQATYFSVPDYRMVLNGSDGCCGDDYGWCHFNETTVCSNFSNNLGLCVQSEGCQVMKKCGGEKDCSLSTSALTCGSPQCNWNEEYYCLRYDYCSNYRSRSTCPDNCFWSEDFDGEGSCNGGSWCVNWQGRCEDNPSANCEDVTDLSNCNAGCHLEDMCSGNLKLDATINIPEIECENNEFLYWEYEPLDSFIMDSGYVASTEDSSARYFCSKDWYIDGEYIVAPYLQTSEYAWKWYDAVGLSVPFKIHNIGNYDFISNGENWSYCAADGNDYNNGDEILINSNANPIFDGGTLDEVSQVFTGYLCAEYLNELILNDVNPFNQEEFPEGISPVCGKTPTGNLIKSYCCEEDATVGILGEELSFVDCEDMCYADNQLIGDYVDEQTDGEFNLNDLFCVLFPASFICDKNLSEDLTMDNDNLMDMTECSKRPSDCVGLSISGEDKSCADIMLEEDIGRDYHAEWRGYGVPCPYTEGNFSFCNAPLPEITVKYYSAVDVKQEDGYNQICCVLDYNEAIEENELLYTTDQICNYKPNEIMSEDLCLILGGDWQQETQNPEYSATCTGYEVEGEGGICCMAGEWEYDFTDYWIQNLAKPGAFICYKHNDEQRFAECCNDFTICKNSQSDALFRKDYVSRGSQYGAWFIEGGALHSVDNFNKYNKSNVLKNYAYYMAFPRGDEISLNSGIWIKIKDQFNNRNPRNWSSFDNLEFDVFTTSFGRLRDLILKDEEDNYCYLTNDIEEVLINGNRTLRWHHTNLDLHICPEDFLMENVTDIYINVTGGNEFEILIDNIYLSNDEGTEGDAINTENYYCTGGFSSWVKNLDGPGDCEGEHCFTEDDKFFKDGKGYGEYQFACQSQPSYDWTGTACCGDDTRVPIKSMDYENVTSYNTNYGEYYADNKYGCFHGVPVYRGETVGYAMFENYFNADNEDHLYDNLMFYNSTYYACEQNKFSNLKTSFDGKYDSNSPNLNVMIRDNYDVISNYVCMPGGYWLHKANIDLSEFLASKMYDLTFKDGTTMEQYANYELYCDNYRNLEMNYTALPKNLKDIILSSCILNIETDTNSILKNRTITGIYFEGRNSNNKLQTFLNNAVLKSHLIEELNILPDDVDDICSSWQFVSDVDNEKMFFGCGEIGRSDIYVSYSDALNMLLFVQSHDFNAADEFEGMFEDTIGSSFFERMLIRLKFFFKDLFQPDEEAETNTLDSPTLPFNSTALNYKKMFLASYGDKSIYAFSAEIFKQTGRFAEDLSLISYQFKNFETDMKHYFERYISNEGIDQDVVEYSLVGNNQIINLVNPNNNQTTSFEPEFDWRWYLGGLKIN